MGEESSLKQIEGLLERGNTAWNEQRTAGMEIQESSSTTLPPNSRFSFFENHTYLTPDEVDSKVTHNQPVYDISLSANDTWVVGGADRNAYVPGFEASSGIAFQIKTEPTSGFLPDSIDMVEAGYATLLDQPVSGIPNEAFDYNKEGAVLHIEDEKVDLRIYKNGSVAAQLEREDWENDPFSLDRFNYTPQTFAVLRSRFDLYGAGDITFFMRLRNSDAEAELVELGTVSIQRDPVLRIYNQHNQLRVEASDSASGSETFSLGPIEYHNRFDGIAPRRNKRPRYRDINIDDTTGDDSWTVVKVYRQDMERREAAVSATGIQIEEGGTNVNTQLRSVHRDFLTFPAGFNPNASGNWIAPGDAAAKETALEEADLDPDSVSLATYTDEDGKVKARGEKEISVYSTSGSGNRSVARSGDGFAPISENEYVVLIAQVGSVNENINLLVPTFEERW